MEKDTKIAELIKTGLSEDQAEVYLALLSRGRTTASKLRPFTSLSRPMLYRILDELIELKLVSKEDAPQMVSLFEATHPVTLRELLEKKREEVYTREKALENVLTPLISDFTALSGKPGVRILQGLHGVSELYEDILNEGKDIQLIRSPLDDTFPDLNKLVLTQINEQVKLGIKTFAITPFVDETPEEIRQVDENNLVDRRLISLEKLDMPAQIIIYADKVAITAFDQELMTTIIQNPAISNSFRLMFTFMWESLEIENEKLRQGILDGSLTPPRPKSKAAPARSRK